MTRAWNTKCQASYYGSLPPMNIGSRSSSSSYDNSSDERSALMNLDHDDNGHCDTTPTTTSDYKKATHGKHSKRLVVFLSVLAAISTTTSTLFLLVFLSQSDHLGLSFHNGSDDDAPWWRSRFHMMQSSAQQVADEALERMNKLSERNRNAGSTNLAAAAAVSLSSSSSPDANNAAWLNLNKENHHDHDHDDSNSQLQEGCEATVIIVRHCEKGNIREHCAYIGYERSVYLATLFGDDDAARWPLPSFIFALAPGGRNSLTKMNFRELETAGPLAQKADVKVNYAYDPEEDRLLAQHVHELLHSGDVCGKVVFIAWKHSRIGHLAHLLGCGPQQHCPMDYKGTTFDPAWTIQFSYRHLLHATDKHLTPPDRHERAKWHVTGSVQYENFDPLAFSKRMGDYPRGGKSMGGASWEDRTTMIPERKRATKNWLLSDDVIKPGFLGVGPPYGGHQQQQQQHDRHDDYWRNKE